MINYGQLRIKFIWGAAKVIQARWHFGLFGFYEHAKGYRDSGLVISVRGLLVLGLCLAMLGYVGAATTLYLWLDHKGHNYVTYTDTLLYPVRQKAISEKRGQAYIDEGIDDLRAQRWSDAEMKLRVGLARYPQATRARLALAEFYMLAHRRAQALKLLEEGLAVVPAYPGRRYLATYFNYANQGEEYARIFAAVDQCLANLREIEPKERNWLLQQKINALLAEKQAEAALVILDQQAPDVIFNEQRVLVLLALGRVPDAGKFLATWRQQDGATAQILRLQVRAFREAGQLKEMDEALEALRLLTPTDPTPYAYALIQRVMAGQATAAAAALDDYFLRFGALVKSVQLLAQPLAEIGAVDLLEQFIKKMAEQGHDRRSALLLLAQAHLKHGQWSAAEQVIAQVKALDAAVGGNASAGLDLMATLVAVTSNPAEGPQVQLLAYLNRQIYPLRSFRTIIDALLLAKRDEVALEVINCAERSYAGNVALAAYKVQAKDALAVQAKAAVGAPVAVKDTILSESAFFSRLDSAMAEKQWAAAADALRDVQLAKPSWLAARQTDVLVRQMRVAEARHEPLDLILAAKLLLAGATAQAQLVVDYAVELHGQNENENAVLLLREVLHKIPNHGLARRWLEEWQKRPEAVLTPPVTTPVPATAAPAVAQPATS